MSNNQNIYHSLVESILEYENDNTISRIFLDRTNVTNISNNKFLILLNTKMLNNFTNIIDYILTFLQKDFEYELRFFRDICKLILFNFF